MNVDLRYHYNQGLGLFLSNTDSGNMTAEMGKFPMTCPIIWRTHEKKSYLKTAFSYDRNTKNISTKLELEYFHQISDIVNENNLSRFQIPRRTALELLQKYEIDRGYISGTSW
ncbi:MAG: hypothetical protein Ct9H300mP2_1890 [Candidatus Neomarinimicrobiota bacterium]|nr:MAG: hypothetical protein Ct9H300mP2_1890 [Candidatus Neomarinimicrobiota bacterium]